MRHQLRPNIDDLENKTLLSQVSASLVAHRLGLKHDVQLVESRSMAVRLTTNETAYDPGQVVAMTLIMTKTSTHNERVVLGPREDGFVITRNGKVIWRSNDGVVPQYIAMRILKPGQSITLATHWTVPASTGSFVQDNQLFPAGPSATLKVTTRPIAPTPIAPFPIART